MPPITPPPTTAATVRGVAPRSSGRPVTWLQSLAGRAHFTRPKLRAGASSRP